MTDPFEGLRLRVPSLPPGGADEAVLAGGRRRARRRVAAVSGGAGTLAAAVVLVVALQPGGIGRASLHVDQPASSGSASASASPTPYVTVNPQDVPSAAASIAPGPMSTVFPSESPSPKPSRSPEPSLYVGHGPTDPSDGGPISERDPITNDPTFCPSHGYLAQNGPDGWCATLTGPTGLLAGTVATYTFTACRDPASGAREAHYDNREEFAVWAQDSDLNDDKVAYLWGEGVAFSGAPHVLTFSAGDCASWRFHWLGQDSEGNALPSGSYTLNVIGTAKEFSGPPSGLTGPIAAMAVNVSR